MDRAERIERRFEVPIVIGALLVIPILIAEQTSPGEPWATLADVGNWLIWPLFLSRGRRHARGRAGSRPVAASSTRSKSRSSS